MSAMHLEYRVPSGAIVGQYLIDKHEVEHPHVPAGGDARFVGAQVEEPEPVQPVVHRHHDHLAFNRSTECSDRQGVAGHIPRHSHE